MTTMNWTFIKPAREACDWTDARRPYADVIKETFGDGTLLHWQCVEHPEYRIKGFWGSLGGAPDFHFLAGVAPESVPESVPLSTMTSVYDIAGVRVRTLASCRTLRAAQEVCEEHIDKESC